MNSDALSTMNSRRICLGVITGAHGIAGQVRIKCYTKIPEDLTGYGPLSSEDGNLIFEISSFKVVKNAIVAKIQGTNSRSEAEALQGTELFVDREVLPDPDNEEWYYSDLISLKVFDRENQLIGVVSTVQNFGAGDLIEITPVSGGDSVLVPFTTNFVPEVDLTRGKLTIDLPEGWISGPDDKLLSNLNKGGKAPNG